MTADTATGLDVSVVLDARYLDTLKRKLYFFLLQTHLGMVMVSHLCGPYDGPDGHPCRPRSPVVERGRGVGGLPDAT